MSPPLRVHFVLPDGTAVALSADALRRRLVPGSPILRYLEDAEEEQQSEFEVDVVQEFPPYLWQGLGGVEALTILLGFLGLPEDDGTTLRRFEAVLALPQAAHMYVVAHWLGAEVLADCVAKWMFAHWMRNSRSKEVLSTELGKLDVHALRMVVRAGLFRRACISERALCDGAKATGQAVLFFSLG